MNRRKFLVCASLVTAAGTVAGACRSPSAISVSGSDEWEQIRKQFNISREQIDLSALFIASHPRPVREAIERYRRVLDESPIIPTFMDDEVRNAWMQDRDPPERTTARRMTPGGFKAFEHQWALAEAFKFHLEIGKEKIAARTHELNRQLKEGLATMSHVKLHTPMSEELSSGIVCFDVDGFSARDVVGRLRQRKIVATPTPYAASHARVSPSIRNSPQEIDIALREIQALA